MGSISINFLFCKPGSRIDIFTDINYLLKSRDIVIVGINSCSVAFLSIDGILISRVSGVSWRSCGVLSA